MRSISNRLMRAAAAGVVCSYVALVAPMGASATPIIDSNTGLSSPDVIVDFGDALFTVGTTITNQFSGQGVTFGLGSPGDWQYIDIGITALSSVQQGALFFPGSGGGAAQLGSIFFDDPVSEAAFSFRANPQTASFSAFLDGNLVENFSAAVSLGVGDLASGKFYGFLGIVFDEVRVGLVNTVASPTLDNLQYSVAPVPVPAALPLLGTGLGILGFLGWRRRRRVVAAAV